MKNRFLFLLLIALLTFPPISSAQNPDRESFKEWVEKVTNRTSEGLSDTRHPNGSVIVGLDGRFQNVLLARQTPYGKVRIGCISDSAQADSFLDGVNDFSRYLFKTDIGTSDTKTAARDHGMSESEYIYYTKLIENYAERRSSLTNSTISIVNNDGAGEGFNDATPAAPEGGNNGATLGAQRLNVFNAAADIWESVLDTQIEIQIQSQFDPLFCTPTQGTLGSASATTIVRDFPGAIHPGTWYHLALAEKLAGQILVPNTSEMTATFNSNLNGSPGCLQSLRFYLGLDNANPQGTINLLVVILHEFGHGLGFSDFANANTGVLFNGFPDVFTTHMFDRTTGKFWNDMSDAERITSAINDGNVLWSGPSVASASGFLNAGRDGSNGFVQLYTPNPVEGGSSISHWDVDTFPNLLMEPDFTLALPLDLDLTKQQMRDVGWQRDTNKDGTPDAIVNVQPSGIAVAPGSQTMITWDNNGGFDQNVTIELSTDNGETYPTVVAEDVPNTGQQQFNVPNQFVARARVRIREEGYLDPAGASSPHFTIGDTFVGDRSYLDIDGDGKTDVGVFRPNPGALSDGPAPEGSTSQWWLLRSSDQGTRGLAFGNSSDTPVPADFTGDGKTDIAFWRPSTGQWFILRSEDDSFFAFPFGAPGDIPAPGDFDGDGKADPAVYRASSGTWFIVRSSDGGLTVIPFGVAADLPIVSDYDGDGMDDVAVYRAPDNQFWLFRSSEGIKAFQFGAAGDRTAVGDWTGDGKSDVAFFRPSEGNWYVIRSEDDSFFAFPWGVGTDTPAPGDYDGDGRFDPAVFRSSDNTWYIFGSTNGFQAVPFGVNGDIPLPNVYVVGS
ncbi:MAG: VCBS repeat-containing protein [Acidobacteria bacterium]|nr:MAG: VCBS repeat-containing protein [Acidobacteriota bacterium]REJ98377.1 MAG: VCBS repeat-containing protein [Acidobacteriota bacterium]REK17121.1 MAG: VCBS repeat-containing protein [Acidobacteriota bacterium]REK43031.1 MAG: VCBS repeat-containing protein [Acidobacteriota bacterium]